jgi:predicted transcriptional regulator
MTPRPLAHLAAAGLRSWHRATSRGEATRLTILGLIRSHPGIHKAELSRRTALSWGTIVYHLGVLKRTGRIVTERHRNLEMAYEARVSPQERHWIGVLGRSEGPDLVDHLRAKPGDGVQSMSRHYNLSRKVIRRHLARLEEAGIVVRSVDYRPKFFLRDGPTGGPVWPGLRGHDGKESERLPPRAP